MIEQPLIGVGSGRVWSTIPYIPKTNEIRWRTGVGI